MAKKEIKDILDNIVSYVDAELTSRATTKYAPGVEEAKDYHIDEIFKLINKS